jgi:hypothetical protein
MVSKLMGFLRLMTELLIASRNTRYSEFSRSTVGFVTFLQCVGGDDGKDVIRKAAKRSPDLSTPLVLLWYYVTCLNTSQFLNDGWKLRHDVFYVHYGVGCVHL